MNASLPASQFAEASTSLTYAVGERVWLEVRGRHVPAVVTAVNVRRVQLRVQRSDRWDAVRIVRGRARAGLLVRRESVHVVDGGVRP